MRFKMMNNIREIPRPLRRMLFPILSSSGKARTSIIGAVVFLLGIGLTIFILANPMRIGAFDKIAHVILHRGGGAGTGATTSGERKVKYWQCPMHPTYIADEPGTCGLCSMALVPTYEDDGGGTTSGERKIKYWRAPMDPTYISDNPGKSPMGMDLVPVYEDESADASENVIRIDPATVQNIGVVSETVERGNLKVEIRTVGNLDYNDQNVFWVNTKYDGWIEKVYINFIGERVEEGQPLFEIYSPDLVSTQEEYLSALRYRDKMADSGFAGAQTRAENLLNASRSRLSYWDISDRQIEQLEEKGRIAKTLTVVSPAAGVVVKKMDQALEGMFTKAGMNLYKIADLSSLWVHVDIYEYQLPWIKVGQEATVQISYYPGEDFVGKVLFFYPYLEAKTRTLRVCVEIPNTEGKLRPGMFSSVTFAPVAAENAVLVPEMAVLHTGERNVVIVDLGGGRFDPRDVKLGLQGEGQYQVLEGLEAGERIVTSSQFLIDSESNLREAINKMLMARRGEKSPEKTTQTPATRDAARGSGTKMLKPVIEDAGTVEALKSVLDVYLPIWKSLADDSTEGIEASAARLAKAASEAAGKVEEESLKVQLEALAKAASEMNAGDLEGARESMKAVSRAIVKIFESHDVKMPEKYTIIECSMVEERWIQDSAATLNPFYGSSMLRCGATVGEIG